MLRTWDVIINELESQDEAEVGQEKTDGAKRWNLNPEGSSSWGEVKIGYLPDNGGNGRHGFGEDVPRFSWMGSVGSCCSDSGITLVLMFLMKGDCAYLKRRVIFWMKLKMAAMAMTTTTPYQKNLANAFPEICNSLSSSISARKSMAWVGLERSRPVGFKAEDGSSPMLMLGMDIDLSIFHLVVVRNVKSV